MNQEPRKRPNMLNFILILVLIIAILLVTLTNNLNTQVTTLLGTIAGYIFGVTIDPRLLKPTGINSMPFAKIKIIQAPGVVSKEVSLDGSDSTDPAGLQLTYKWEISSAPKGSEAKIEKSTDVTASFNPKVAGTYEIKLTVSNQLQDSKPETVKIQAENPDE